jgi:uncharacterized protein
LKAPTELADAMTPRSTLETLALRLPPDVDLRQTLRSIALQESITAGIILSGIGSLKTVTLRFAGQNTHTIIDSKHEILTLAGTIGLDGVHLHMSVANAQGEVIGGHVVDGCIVYTTIELAIGILPDRKFQRELDDRTGFAELTVKPVSPVRQ